MKIFNPNLTPAEKYMKRMIDALSEVIENPDNGDWQEEVMALLFERPKTLRSALSAAFYKSQVARS